MSIQFNQFQQCVEDVLRPFDKFYSPEVVDLLMLTAAVESDGVSYVYQIGGPAIGPFQMEQPTFEDILRYVHQKATASTLWMWLESELEDSYIYTKYLSELRGPLNPNHYYHLAYNFRAAILAARIKYWMDPKPLGNTIEEHAATWKRVYNTHLGKGKPEEAIKKYNTWKSKGFIR